MDCCQAWVCNSVSVVRIQCPLEHRVDCCRRRLQRAHQLLRSIQCPLEHRVDCCAGNSEARLIPTTRFNARLSIEWIAAVAAPAQPKMATMIQCPLEHRVDCCTCAAPYLQMYAIQCPLEHRVDCCFEIQDLPEGVSVIQCPLEHRVDCCPLSTMLTGTNSRRRFNARLSIEWIAACPDTMSEQMF